MRSAVITVVVDNVPGDVLGVKEAAAMALEGLGRVRVTQVQMVEDEQLRVDNAVEQGETSVWTAFPLKPCRRPAPQNRGTSPRPAYRKPPVTIDCCLSCARYKKDPGRNEDGKLHWGICVATGRPLHEVNKRCGGWVREEGS